MPSLRYGVTLSEAEAAVPKATLAKSVALIPASVTRPRARASQHRDLPFKPTDVCFSPATPQTHLTATLFTFLLRSLPFRVGCTVLSRSCGYRLFSRSVRASKGYLTCGVHSKPSELVGDSVVSYNNVGTSSQHLSHLSSANECSRCAWTPLPSQHGRGTIHTFAA